MWYSIQNFFPGAKRFIYFHSLHINKFSIGRLRGVHISNIVNEGIRPLLNLFIFFIFFIRRFHTHQKHKMHASEQKQRRQHFYAHKHIRGGKSLVCLFAFLWFLCFLCFLVCETKKTAFLCAWKHLRGRKSLVWRFVLFMLFVLFLLFMHIKNI